MICKAPSVWGRLNAFQQVMLHWSGLHPYNATHTYRVAGPLDPHKLREAVRNTNLAHGLGVVHLSDDGRSYRHEADLEPEIRIVEAGPDVSGCLASHLSRELNQPFERPVCRPLRFSAIPVDSQSHYVSATYDHWVADSVGARLILRNVLGRYLGLDIPENRHSLELYPGTFREVFGRQLCGLNLAMAAARSLRQWNRNRSAWQVALWSSTEWTVNHQVYQTPSGTVSRLREFARELGATVHDVFLAALGRAMTPLMPARSKGRDLALGSIVDARAEAEEDLSSTVGAFLAYYLVRCQPDAGASLADTVRRIAAMTRPIKARRRYMDSLVNMSFINQLWPRLSESVKPYFMRKALPMTAGISNVLLREPWIDRNRESILDYSRAASTGPMLPLVLTPTTMGDQMNIGVTYRAAGFPRAKIDGVMEMFLSQIERPDEPSRVVPRSRRDSLATRAEPAPVILRHRKFQNQCQ